ncbi:MAG: TIGR03088 family PEP-CTERM/XrtA system glycosyltransferase [Halieaceae bacterium]|uniref:TIGR03088 family PEP-CTERM/XrtA system glycosyltransferase n=1 Tax=Haliea alexandrii TaxID=2448162 RepID=UPI000F0BB380|nr:TIGR03088 family PEP-CTERM/XrtA system glycosyltransferase [Haliea alexandrii]MCR9186191.1 TIGR03088 family PEP-CTERM/XrtA system glycosyltransferase [Halieaceae bacterium]
MTVSANAPPLVVHIIFALGTGGLENGLINIINRCPPERYRHAIICLTRSEEFSARITAPGVEVIELHKKPGHDPGMYWRLWRTLRRLRPAIVHTRNLAALETHALGILLTGCKRVHGEHGRDISDLDGSNRKYQLLRRMLNPLIHRFIAVSRDLSDWLVTSVGISPDKVVQIYNGVAQDSFTPQISEAADRGQVAEAVRVAVPGMPEGFCDAPQCRVVGTVGRLAAVKDQKTLLVALAKIFRDSPQRRDTLRCILVGDGPERSALQKLLVELGLQSCVWMAGDRDDIPELLACMDVFVLPSLGEGISNTVLEAMATGLPVVATRVGGNPELVEHGVNGLLVPVGDAAALAEALQGLADDPVKCKQMGNAAVQRIQRDFDWERTVYSYLQVYDKLLERTCFPESMERT